VPSSASLTSIRISRPTARAFWTLAKVAVMAGVEVPEAFAFGPRVSGPPGGSRGYPPRRCLHGWIYLLIEQI